MQPAVLRRRALGDDDDREAAALGVAAAQAVADLLDVERPLGDEDDVGAAGEAAVGGDPARVAAHDLDDDDAVVRLRRRVQAVDRVRGDLHRGLEAEREVRAREVVVDRLGDADDGTPASDSLPATPSVSSPPIGIRASSPSSSSEACTRSSPSSSLNGFVRDVPRIVPPRCRIPRVVSCVSGDHVVPRARRPSRSVKPKNSWP